MGKSIFRWLSRRFPVHVKGVIGGIGSAFIFRGSELEREFSLDIQDRTIFDGNGVLIPNCRNDVCNGDGAIIMNIAVFMRKYVQFIGNFREFDVGKRVQ